MKKSITKSISGQIANIIIGFLFLAAFFTLDVQAQKYETAKWQVLDIPFKLNNAINKPFELVFGAVFSHEEGKTIRIPAFYNDDNQWIIRFSPQLEGTWKYRTYSTQAKLAGIKGEVNVNPNTKADEHGPLLVAKENPQKLVYADGSPYFLMAFELDWLFALDWDNRDDIPKTKQIISHVKDNQFNQIVMNVYAYDASWGDRNSIQPAHNFAKPKVFPFGGTNENPDYSALNVDFFKHLDRVIAHLDHQEIIAHLMIYVWNKKVNWPDPTSEADNRYFEYVVKRYQAFPNILWDISKEALAYGRDDIHYITERIDRLRKIDGHKRLVTVHDYQYCDQFPGKVDIISKQDWNIDIYQSMSNALEKHAFKPVFNIEHGGYEKSMYSIFDGAYNDPIVCLSRNYECVFAGTYSTYYWQNTSWYNVVYDPMSLEKSNRPHFIYYKHLYNLFNQFNFNELKPRKFSTYTLTNEKDLYLFYLKEGTIAITGDLPELKNKIVAIHWYNPLTGEYLDAGQKSFEKGTWMSVRKPDAVESPMAVAIFKVIN